MGGKSISQYVERVAKNAMHNARVAAVNTQASNNPILKSFPEGYKAVAHTGDDALRGAADIAVDKGVKYGVKGAKAMVTKDPKGAHFLNGYTGLKESKTLIGTTAVLGGGYATTASSIRSSMYEKPGQTSYAGEAPIMNADAVGSTAPSTSSAPTLGATGSMVFGLHNSRKG